MEVFNFDTYAYETFNLTPDLTPGQQNANTTKTETITDEDVDDLNLLLCSEMSEMRSSPLPT